MSPFLAKATSAGLLNSQSASAPVLILPSTNKTVPKGSNLSTRWLPSSVVQRLPSASMRRPCGWEKSPSPMLCTKLPFSSYSASIGLVRWNRKMWPFAFTATAEASPAIMSLGNLKKLVRTRYGNSGTAWNGLEAMADTWAQACQGDTAINASTISIKFLRFLTVLRELMPVFLAQNAVRGKTRAKSSKQAASVRIHERLFVNDGASGVRGKLEQPGTRRGIRL